MAVKYLNITCMYLHIANRVYNPIGLCKNILWNTHTQPAWLYSVRGNIENFLRLYIT